VNSFSMLGSFLKNYNLSLRLYEKLVGLLNYGSRREFVGMKFPK